MLPAGGQSPPEARCIADELLYERQSQLPEQVQDPEILALLPYKGQSLRLGATRPLALDQ